MAFKLKKLADGIWEGKINDGVEVGVRSNQTAKTVRIAYAGKQDGDAPFEFDIRTGLSSLLVVALGVKNGQVVDIVEIDGTQTQVLKTFIWSKQNFFDVVQVRGKRS